MVEVHEGVLQLGSTKWIMEDLSFALCMQRKLNFLHLISGVFVQHSASGSGMKRSSPSHTSGMASPSPHDMSYGNGAQLTLRSIDQFLSPRQSGAASDPW